MTARISSPPPQFRCGARVWVANAGWGVIRNRSPLGMSDWLYHVATDDGTQMSVTGGLISPTGPREVALLRLVCVDGVRLAL